jgi:hypothetical protein
VSGPTEHAVAATPADLRELEQRLERTAAWFEERARAGSMDVIDLLNHRWVLLRAATVVRLALADEPIDLR